MLEEVVTLTMGNWLTWALLSAFFAALTAVLAKVGVAGVDSNLATAVRTSVVVVFTWLLVALTGEAADVQMFSRKTWLFLVLSGLATGLSWLCYFHALKVGPVSKVAPIDKLSVVLVIVFGALFLGERIERCQSCRRPADPGRGGDHRIGMSRQGGSGEQFVK